MGEGAGPLGTPSTRRRVTPSGRSSQDAKTNGFMDCVEITESWGYSGLRWQLRFEAD